MPQELYTSGNKFDSIKVPRRGAIDKIERFFTEGVVPPNRLGRVDDSVLPVFVEKDHIQITDCNGEPVDVFINRKQRGKILAWSTLHIQTTNGIPKIEQIGNTTIYTGEGHSQFSFNSSQSPRKYLADFADFLRGSCIDRFPQEPVES